MGEVRGLYSVIQLRDRLSAPLRKANASLDKAKTKMGRVGLAVDKLKTKMRRASAVIKQHQMAFAALGAAFMAIAYGGFRILLGSARNLEEAFVYLAAQTGVTGEELNRLKGTLIDLAMTNSDSFKTIGSVMDRLRARFGNLGDDFEMINQGVLDFSKVTGIDGVRSAELLGRALQTFEKPATDMYNLTDLLIGQHQQFGLNISEAIPLLKSYGGVFESLGMNINEAVGFIQAIEKSGFRSTTVMMGLRTAVEKFKTPEEFWETLEVIAAIEDKSLRTAKATEVFGSTAGPAVEKMLRHGIDGLKQYMLTVDEVAGVTKEASAGIDEGFNEQLKIMKNRIAVVTAVLGEGLLVIVKSLNELIGKLTGKFSKMSDRMKSIATIGATVGIVAAAIAGGMLLIATASTLLNFGAVAAGFMAIAGGIWAAAAPLLPFIAAFGILAIVLQHMYKRNLFGFADAVKKVAAGVKIAFGIIIKVFKALISGFVVPFKAVFGPVLKMFGLFNKTGKESSFLVTVINAIGGTFKRLHTFLEPHFPLIKKIFKVIGALGAIMVMLPFLPLIFGIRILFTAVKALIGSIKWLIDTFKTLYEVFGNLKDTFFDAGANLIKAFVDGIKAFATAPVDAIKEIGGRIRAFLPFSDAEMGPLADITLSGRKLVETFGKGIASEMPMLGNLAKLMPAPAEMIGSTTTTMTDARHSEDKRVTIGKIELHIDGVSNNAEEIGDLVIYRIKREFEKYGI